MALGGPVALGGLGPALGDPGFALARLSGEPHDQRLGAGRETVDRGVDGIGVARWAPRVALGAGRDLVERLGAAQQQHRQHGEFVAVEAERIIDDVFVLAHPVACAAHRACEPSLAQLEHERIDLALAEVQHRVAAGRLVAGSLERLGGQRVVVGGGFRLLDQRREDPGVLGTDIHALDLRSSRPVARRVAVAMIQASTTVSPSRWNAPVAGSASDAPSDTAATAAAATPADASR